MTNDGSGASIAAPGRASATVISWINSSEPLPSISPSESGMPNARDSALLDPVGGDVGIAIDGDLRERGTEPAPHRIRQRERVLHRVELDHAFRGGDRVRRQGANLRSHDRGHDASRVESGRTVVHESIRYSALAACAGSPSPRASVAAIAPSVRAPSRDTAITLVRF